MRSKSVTRTMLPENEEENRRTFRSDGRRDMDIQSGSAQRTHGYWKLQGATFTALVKTPSPHSPSYSLVVLEVIEVITPYFDKHNFLKLCFEKQYGAVKAAFLSNGALLDSLYPVHLAK